MDEAINKIMEELIDELCHFSYSDQSYMALEISDRLKEFSSECLAIEYNLIEE